MSRTTIAALLTASLLLAGPVLIGAQEPASSSIPRGV